MAGTRINSEVMIYDRSLRKGSYKAKFPFSTNSLNFDIETKASNTITIVNYNELDLEFSDVIAQGDYVVFTYQDFKYFGVITDYDMTGSNISMDLEISLNYDALDFNFELSDLTENDTPGENQLWLKLGGYKALSGLPGLLLAYAKFGLESTYPFTERSPYYTLADVTEGLEYKFEDLYERPETFSELVRHIHKVYGIRLDVSFNNKVLEGAYEWLPEDAINGIQFVNCVASKSEYSILELYKANSNHVVGDLEISFQRDRPNMLDLDVYVQDSEDELVQHDRRMYIVCNDGIVRESTNVTLDMMPYETIYSYERYEYDLSIITDEIMLGYAIAQIGTNYANEITFKTTRKALGMEVNDKNIYNFFDVLGRPVLFHLSPRRRVLTRITSIEVTDNEFLTVKLGASRQRLTDRLRRVR